MLWSLWCHDGGGSQQSIMTGWGGSTKLITFEDHISPCIHSLLTKHRELVTIIWKRSPAQNCFFKPGAVNQLPAYEKLTSDLPLRLFCLFVKRRCKYQPANLFKPKQVTIQEFSRTQIGREPQYFSKWKTISFFSQMEDDLNFSKTEATQATQATQVNQATQATQATQANLTS